MNYPDLVAGGCTIRLADSQHRFAAAMPNPLRDLAQGEPLYTVMIDKWNDDVSGNVSKSYNKHYNTYIANRNLPRKLLQQEYHVHFVGTSQHASPAEQTAAVKEMIRYGIECITTVSVC